MNRTEQILGFLDHNPKWMKSDNGNLIRFYDLGREIIHQSYNQIPDSGEPRDMWCLSAAIDDNFLPGVDFFDTKEEAKAFAEDRTDDSLHWLETRVRQINNA